jgi:hypothetical protein
MTLIAASSCCHRSSTAAWNPASGTGGVMSLRNGGGNSSDPGRSAHILMEDQPCCATCWQFIGPNADQFSRRIAEETREFSNTCVIGHSVKLDEWIVAAERREAVCRAK